MKMPCIPEKHIMYKTADEVSHLCKPLFLISNINYFAYFRIAKNNYLTGLLSDASWFKYFVEKGYEHHNGKKLTQGYHLWKNTFTPHMLNEIRENFDHDHGLYIVSESSDYTETYVFSTKAGNDKIYSYYLNNIHVLKQFAFYFKQKTEKLMLRAQLQPINVSLAEDNTLHKIDEHVSINEYFPLENYQVKTSKGVAILTTREFQIIKLLERGYSAKEIGGLLKLSNRTIESHLSNIRKKLCCNNRRQIIKILYENNL